MKANKKRGARGSWVVYGGQEMTIIIEGKLTGVLWDKGAKSHFIRIPNPDGSWTKRNLSRDRDKTSRLFEQLKAQYQSKPVKLIELPKPEQQIYTDADGKPYPPDWQKGYQDSSFVDGVSTKSAATEQWLLEQLDRMLEDPVGLARKLGREDLARLPELQAKVTYKLGYLYDEFVKKTVKPLDKKYLCDVRFMWQQFLDATGLTNESPVDHINRKSLNTYHDFLIAEKKKQDWSTTWMNHRVVFLKSLLKYSKKRLDDNSGIIKALEITNDILTQQQQPSMDPHPISIKDFWALFNTANDTWKLILLLALNSAAYFKDIFDMQIENFDLKKGALVMERTKTHLPKCAMLWPETLKLLKQHLKNRKDTLPWLFISSHGNRYKVISMMGYFRKVLRPASKVSKNITFNHIRDGVKTASEIMKCRPEDISIVMGWKREGVEDHYLKRNPGMTKDCLDKVRDYYQVAKHI